MDTYEENKLINEKVTKTKTMMTDLNKQIERAFKEKDVLNMLKQNLQAQVKAKEESQSKKLPEPTVETTKVTVEPAVEDKSNPSQ